MRRRRSKSVQPGVSLFPFLAVLICTLGVLIVLLVLAVQTASIKKADLENAVVEKDAEQTAEQAAALQAKKARQQEIVAKLEDQIDRHIIEAEGFGEARPETRRELAAARDYRAHLEKEIQEIEEQAKQLAAEIKLLDSDLSQPESEVNDAEVNLLQQKVEFAQSMLEQKRNSIEVIEQKKYAIVPYRGAGGTKRIPVFVECNSSGLVLQPWGIQLKKEDFFHPVTAGNPVDAALATVRNYYQKHELSDSDQRPYPLLVVRPDGAQSYGLARRSLVSWDDEFGYELVAQDKDLEFGTVDPQLAEEILASVNKAKLNQLALRKRHASLAKAQRSLAAGRFASGGQATGGLRSSSQHGGFVREGTGSGTPGQQRQTAQNQSHSGDQNGDQSHDQNEISNQTQKASFQGAESSKDGEKISSTFQPGSASHANASFANNTNQSSAGPNASGISSAHESLANARGSNWALPTQTNGATGYIRPVSLVCRKDSLTIKNVAGENVTIPIGDQPSEAVDAMVNIIWQRIDAWGIAGASAFWKPNLAVTVEPGAQHRFAMIKQMLRGSGLGVEEASK